MSVLKEFKEFAVRGNVVDMAVGIVIGAAFGKIVSSLVADVLMPPIGVVVGGANFSGLSLTLKQGAADAKSVTLNYGTFIQTVLDFVIVAFAMFALIKTINILRKKEEQNASKATPPRQEILLEEIRDLLKAGAKK